MSVRESGFGGQRKRSESAAKRSSFAAKRFPKSRAINYGCGDDVRRDQPIK